MLPRFPVFRGAAARRLRSEVRKCRFFATESKNREEAVDHNQIRNSLPSEVDVVVIGGGSLGCNTLYSLAKMGVTNAVLLEKDQLTAGTTWHTAGLVWSLRPSDVEIELLSQARQLMTGIEHETGVHSGWINNGGLFIANNKERLDEYKRLYSIGKVFGIESHVLGPEDTKKLYPLMNVNDIFGTLYSPSDGTIDPTGFCTALTRSATKAGAKVIQHCPVTGITTQEHSFGTRKVSEVQTKYGTIRTRNVINCTGAWGNYIANMVGLKVPLVAMKHAYVTTERIPGIENMPNVRDHDASVYLKLQGDALHIGGYEHNPIILDKVEKDFAFGLYELDWDVFGVHIEGACNRVPVLETIGIKSTVCGPESFTPDHKPILGEDPRVRGFFHGCGFNSGGMMFGVGCGSELAKWVLNGRPDMDLYGYDIRRFCPEVSSNNQWSLERSHESYAKNYSMIFAHDEPLAGRNMKKDPLHSEMEAAGCVFQERFGWERPGWFSLRPDSPARVQKYDWYGAYKHPLNHDDGYKKRLDLEYTFQYPPHQKNIKAECLSTRFHAAVFNMSYFGKFFLSGRDAKSAVDYIFTNEMSVPEGKTVYTCMLNSKGGIEADLTVSVLSGNEYYIAAAGGVAYQNWAHILRTVQDQGFEVQLRDQSREMGMLSIQGPKARDILLSLTDADLSNNAFPFSSNKFIRIAGHEVLALRVSFVGELGWELHIPKDSCVAVYNAVMEAGRPLGLVNAAYRAIDSLSIEKGYPHWHQELRIDDNPLEAGLMFTCKVKSDTNFNGREALETYRKQKLKKKKVCFTLKDKSACLVGLEAVFRNGQPVGYVRRADYAFYVDQPIAYGYIRLDPEIPNVNEWLRRGQYEIEQMGVRFDAKLHLKSPFDPDNKRLQGDYSGARQISVPDEELLIKYRSALRGDPDAVGQFH